jgi:hypothetical protein
VTRNTNPFKEQKCHLASADSQIAKGPKTRMSLSFSRTKKLAEWRLFEMKSKKKSGTRPWRLHD